MEELCAQYSSPNIIQVIKSRTMKWAGYAARIGERRHAYRVLVGQPEGKNHVRDPGVDGRIIIKWIFQGVGWVGIDLAQDRGWWWSVVNAVMNLQAA